MAKVRLTQSGVSFECPGCGERHVVPCNPGWSWNQSVDRPTLHPSLSVASGHYASSWKPGDRCWCTYAAGGNASPFKCGRCHSIVTDGRIFFCADSTHALAGQTVDLPDV